MRPEQPKQALYRVGATVTERRYKRAEYGSRKLDQRRKALERAQRTEYRMAVLAIRGRE